MLQINETKMRQSWAKKIAESLGIEDQKKVAWMSEYAFNHDMRDRKNGSVNESVWGNNHLDPNMNMTGSGAITWPDAGTDNTYRPDLAGSGHKPTTGLPLALQIAAHTVALECVRTVPIPSKKYVVTYLDYVYDGGRLDNMLKGDLTPGKYAEGGYGNTASPYVVKIGLKFDKTGSDGLVKNAKYYFDKADNKDFELVYAYPSRIDGKPIFGVYEKWGQTGEPTIGGEGASLPIYEYVAGLNDGTHTLVDAAGVEVPIINGGTKEDPTGTVDIENVKAFEDHITAFSGEGMSKKDMNSNNPYSHELGEATPGRKISPKLFTLDIKCTTFKADSSITREQMQDMKDYGQDPIALMQSMLVNETTQAINKLLLDKMFNLGALNAQQIEEVEGWNNTSCFFTTNSAYGTETLTLGTAADGTAITTTVNSTYVGGGAETLGTIQRRIASKILAASNTIAVRGRWGKGTGAVVSGAIGTALQDCQGFIAYPVQNTLSQTANTLYPIGALAGMNIYVDPNMNFNDNRVCVFRNGNDKEPGIYFMPYLLADNVQTTSEFTFAPVMSMESIFAVAEVGHHPQVQYLTFAVGTDGTVSLY